LAPDTVNPDSIFSDIRVRQAIDHAIDRETTCEELGHGFLTASDQFSPPGKPGYVPGLGRPYDPDKAKQLLEEAGYPDGFETTIICSTQFSIPDVMTAIQDQLSEVNIKVTLDYADPGRWSECRYRSGWKDALLFTHNGWFASVPRGMNFVLSAVRHDNFSMERPPGCEELLQEILREGDFETQLALMEEMAKLLNDYAMYINLYKPMTITVSHDYVHDHGCFDWRQSLTFWTMHDCWLSK